MQLLGIPDKSGKPFLWINADHLVSVQPVMRTETTGIDLDAEVKVDGMPLQRVPLGTHVDRDAAEAAFQTFLELLQA